MKPDAIQVAFPDLAVLPQGDGTFLIKPGRPVLQRERVSVNQAVRRFGASTSTWLRLFDAGFVEGDRPSPRKTFLYVDSIRAHLQASGDPEFWTAARRRKFYSAISAT